MALSGNPVGFAIAASALAMTAIVAARYLASSGLFAWLTQRRHPEQYSGLGQQMRREIGWSLASAAIYGIPAGVVAWGWQERGWTQIYSDVGTWSLWYLPISLLAYVPGTYNGPASRVYLQYTDNEKHWAGPLRARVHAQR